MKKFGQMSMIALLGAMALVSCKKDHTCACNVAVEAYTLEDNGATLTVEAQDTTINFAYTDVSKKDAKSKCDASEKSLSTEYNEFFDNHATVGCEVK